MKIFVIGSMQNIKEINDYARALKDYGNEVKRVRLIMGDEDIAYAIRKAFDSIEWCDALYVIWKNSYPSFEKIKMVADYFKVSMFPLIILWKEVIKK